MASSRSTMINDMTSGPLTRQIVLYSAPIVLANLLQTLYNLVDLAVVGQVVGSVGVSAVSTSGQITFLLYALGIGLGSGAQIMIAQQVGAGEHKTLSRTIGTAFTATIVLAAAVTVLGLLLKNTGLAWLQTPSEAMLDAQQYMFWCCLGIPFTYGYQTVCSVLRGMGDSKTPMVIIAIAAVTNMVLDLVLVWGFGMRAKGAAIATSIAQLMSCVFSVVYLYRRREKFGFDFRLQSFRVDRRLLVTMAELSAPLAFQSMAINISMMFINAWVNVYGVIASAVSGIGSKLYGVASIITTSMQTAQSTFTGQNIAAGQIARVKRSMFVSSAICLGYWVILSVVCLLFPRAVFSIFTTEAGVLDMAPGYMKILVVMFLSFATMAVPIGFLTGIGYVRLNFIIAIADGVVARIGLSLLLASAFGMGLYGYWWGSALAGFVSSIWSWGYYFFGKWQERKLLVG